MHQHEHYHQSIDTDSVLLCFQTNRLGIVELFGAYFIVILKANQRSLRLHRNGVSIAWFGNICTRIILTIRGPISRDPGRTSLEYCITN